MMRRRATTGPALPFGEHARRWLIHLVLAAIAVPAPTTSAHAQVPNRGCMTKTGISLRVPGPWNDHGALAKMISTASFDTAQIELEPHDPDLQRAMFVGSGRSLDDATNAAIAAHKSIACVSFEKTPAGIEKNIASSLAALRERGGYAVNVPKSGLSHGWDRWQKIMATPSPDALLQVLVLQVPDRAADRLCSFGMKQFGLPDACVMRDASSTEVAWVVFEFNRHSWLQQPVLKTGQTFSRNLPDATRYLLALVPDARYESSHEFHNPFGLFELSSTKARR
jgi:hypothetical protein